MAFCGRGNAPNFQKQPIQSALSFINIYTFLLARRDIQTDIRN